LFPCDIIFEIFYEEKRLLMLILKTISLGEQESYKDKDILHVLLCQNAEQLKNISFANLFSGQEFAAFLEKERYNFSSGEIKTVQLLHQNNLHHFLFAGIAKNNTDSMSVYFELIRTLAGSIIQYARQKKITELYLRFDLDSQSAMYQEKVIEVFVTAASLKAYVFDFFMKAKEFQDFECYFKINDEEKEVYQKAFDKGLLVGQVANFSRYLSDMPAGDMYPECFVNRVMDKLSLLSITNATYQVLSLSEMEKLGMGGIIGVGKGSVREPKMLILSYAPDFTSEAKTIALVGKGVTFDTGGISIKPSDGMEDMKADMSGGAAVVGAFLGLARLKSPYKIHAIVPLAENMVDGNSYRPGDILTFYNKKTSEIKNTDAEGRLILADALSYASDVFKPDIMIDLATLTGAARIALGPVYAGLMSENSNLVETIVKAGEETYERCWRMPLEEAYKPNMTSHVADMCNIGTKGYKAGTTMGGMFLREFVPSDIRWAHIDIAPVATDCPNKTYFPSYGATGFGVQLLIELLETKKYFG
jgi:leucyl aminopeptidase